MSYAQLKTQLHSLIRGEIHLDFNAIALEIYAYQVEQNNVYRDYCAQLGKAPTDWKAIPALPLEAFKTHEIACFSADAAEAVFYTSGTTGKGPGRHFLRSLALYRESCCKGWQLSGLPQTNVMGLLPSPEEAIHSSLSRMAGWLIPNRDDFFIRNGQPQWSALEQRLHQASKTAQPLCLFGTALAFLDWFEHMASRSIALPVGSLAVETGGYKGSRRELPKAELYAMFEQRLGLLPSAIINEYGMTELSSQFYARGIEGYHFGPPWIRAIVIDPSTGREAREGSVGVLKIIDLANLDSCIALQTRDLAIHRGDQFQLLGRDPNALPRGCSLSADELLRNEDLGLRAASQAPEDKDSNRHFI